MSDYAAEHSRTTEGSNHATERSRATERNDTKRALGIMGCQMCELSHVYYSLNNKTTTYKSLPLTAEECTNATNVPRPCDMVKLGTYGIIISKQEDEEKKHKLKTPMQLRDRIVIAEIPNSKMMKLTRHSPTSVTSHIMYKTNSCPRFERCGFKIITCSNNRAHICIRCADEKIYMSQVVDRAAYNMFTEAMCTPQEFAIRAVKLVDGVDLRLVHREFQLRIYGDHRCS